MPPAPDSRRPCAAAGGVAEEAASRRGSRRSACLQLLLLALPAGGYLAFVAAYGTNTIVADQWADVGLLQRAYAGRLDLAALWAPHNENRTFVPNLLVLAQAHLDHLDTHVEAYLAASVLVATAALLVVAHRSRAPGTPWVLYFPVVALLLTLGQYENTLLGYQISWYLALLGIVVALGCVDRRGGRPLALALALAAALLASLSSFAGLFVWPAGLVLLVLRRRPPAQVAVWLGAAALTAALYAYHLDLASPSAAQDVAHHPLGVVGFFFVLLGDVLGYGVTNLQHATATEILLGLAGGVVLGASLHWFRRGLRPAARDGAAPLGCALIAVGLVFAASTAAARVSFGTWEATASRYVTFDVLPIAGSYLVWLATTASGERALRRPALRRLGQHRLPAAVAVAVVLVPALLGVYHGVQGGRSTRAYDDAASDVVVNIERAPDALVELDVYPLGNPAVVRSLAAVARRHRLSLFDTPAAAEYERRGLDVGSSVPLPASPG